MQLEGSLTHQVISVFPRLREGLGFSFVSSGLVQCSVV